MDYITEKHLDTYTCNPKQRKYNSYDVTNDYGIGYTKDGREFYFDLEDYDKIKNYYWQFNNRGYAYFLYQREGKNIKVFFHRLIMNPEHGMVVDHINGVKYDNRKVNLRIVTLAQNNLNHRLFNTNTSGHTGVIWIKNRNRWMARIEYQGKTTCLGLYRNIEDAIKARENAEDKYYGEYSYSNSQEVAKEWQVV